MARQTIRFSSRSNGEPFELELERIVGIHLDRLEGEGRHAMVEMSSGAFYLVRESFREVIDLYHDAVHDQPGN